MANDPTQTNADSTPPRANPPAADTVPIVGDPAATDTTPVVAGTATDQVAGGPVASEAAALDGPPPGSPMHSFLSTLTCAEATLDDLRDRHMAGQTNPFPSELANRINQLREVVSELVAALKRTVQGEP